MMPAQGFWTRILPRVSGALAQRLLAAAVLLPVALLVVWAGGWLFLLAVGLAAVLMYWELYRLPWPAMSAPPERRPRHAPSGRLPERGSLRIEFALVATVTLAALVLSGLGAWTAAVLALAGALLAAIAIAWKSGRNPLWAAVRVGYIGLPCLALAWLRDGPIVSGKDGLAATLTLLSVVWASDSLAYLFGRTIGGPRLLPRVSPNKTWAGLVGALVGGILVGGGAALVLDRPLPDMMAAGAVLAVIAQLGDLVASAVKRHYMVKDYSGLIPGHGGLLDRIDGVLFVAPAGLFLLWLIG